MHTWVNRLRVRKWEQSLACLLKDGLVGKVDRGEQIKFGLNVVLERIDMARSVEKKE